MRGLSRGLVVTLVLTLLAAIGGTWIGARYIYDQRHQPSLHEFVHEELELSGEQKQSLRVLQTGEIGLGEPAA